MGGWSGGLNFLKFWRNIVAKIYGGGQRFILWSREGGRDRESPAFALVSGRRWGWLFFELS